MTLLPESGLLRLFAGIILTGCLSVAVHDWIEHGLKRRADRLRGPQ